jgi:uncharacterized protein YndB with AHSA1/START domain
MPPEQPLADIPSPDVLRFERVLPHPVERVWDAIATPAGVEGWLAGGTLEPIVGGAVDLHFDDDNGVRGTVTTCRPPAELEYTWLEDPKRRESIVRFELRPHPDGTLLVLTHRLLDELAGFGAGWHAHLDMLEGQLDGREVDWRERWDALSPRYRELVGARG